MHQILGGWEAEGSCSLHCVSRMEPTCPRDSLDQERANVLEAGVRTRAENRGLDEVTYVQQITPVSFPKLHWEKRPRPDTYAQEK